jgi:biopolymer transport protein ExbD
VRSLLGHLRSFAVLPGLAALGALLATFTASCAAHPVHTQESQPEAVKREDAARGWQPPLVVVDSSRVTLDRQHVADTQELAADERTERIEPMIALLDAHTRDRAATQSRAPFRAVLQAPDSIPFRVIRKVLFSLAQASYQRVSFAGRDVGNHDDCRGPNEDAQLIAVLVHGDGYVLYADGPTPTTFVNSGDEYDGSALHTALSKRKALRPHDEVLTLAVDDEVSFEDLTATMKLGEDAGFPCLSLSAGLGGSAHSPQPQLAR